MNRQILRLVWALVLLLTPGLAFAQVGTIRGSVVDTEGLPLPGASVALQEDIATGTVADANGEFQLEVPAGPHTLLVSFVGYDEYSAPVTVNAGETLDLRIEMQQSGVNLGEVVVTALGIEREERSLGYAHQEVNAEAIERSNESSLVNALAGKVAGLEVTSSSGQPGKAARLIIRGNSSFVGENQPLFVVDGMPISNAEDINPEAGNVESTVFTGGTISRALDLDPNVIEEITVLKGAAAMALYGSRAANGAIIIKTKTGAGATGTRVTFSSTLRWDDAIIDGFQNKFTEGDFGCFTNGLPANRGGMVDASCFGNYYQQQFGGTPQDQGLPYDTWEEYAANEQATQTTRNWGPSVDSVNSNAALLSQLGVGTLPVFDPRRDFYQTGTVTENNLSVSGGAPGGSYFLSGSYVNQGGIVPSTKMDRGSILAKYTGTIARNFNTETSINYVHTDNDWVREGNGADSYLYGLNFTSINYDVSKVTNPDGTQASFHPSFNNPLWLTQNNTYDSGVDRFIGSVGLTYNLLPWLKVSERAGIDTYNDKRNGQVNIGTQGQYSDGMVFNQKITRREVNSDLILQATRTLGGGFAIDALLGQNYNRQHYDYDYVQGLNLGVPGFFELKNASVLDPRAYLEQRELIGVYSQATLNYQDWAYLTLTGRNDWSSTLPANHNSYFYPSASVGFIFTNVLPLLDNTPLSYGKLRASITRIGNDAPVYSTTTPFVKSDPGDGVRGEIKFPLPNGTVGFELSNVLGNPDLKPELSTEYEVGTNLRFFGQRGRFDLSYYNRTTTDQIFSVPVSAATGYVQKLLNAGKLRNSGIELTFAVTPIEARDFSWDIQANWSRNRTDVVDLTSGIESIYLAGFEAPQIRVQRGKNGYGVIFGSGFLRANKEDMPDLFAANPGLKEGTLLIGTDGLPMISDELLPIGNIQPDWTGSLRTSLTFKGLTASALLDVRHGGDILNFDLFYTTFYGTAEVTENRGSTYVYDGFAVDTDENNNLVGVGPNTTEIVRDKAYYQDFYSFVDENFIESGGFMKLREISLGYRIPTSMMQRIGIQGAQVIASARNLWTKTDFSYGDPEGSLIGAGNGQGFYHMVTPSTRSFSLGVKLTL